MNSRIIFIAAAMAGSLMLQAETGYKITARYPMNGTEGWDYVTVDSAARRIYVSHGTQVEVLDADSGKQTGVIADTPGVHGIAIAQGMNRGFTSNGRENKVSIFDTKTLKLIEKIDVGKGPDGIYYHAASKRVFTCNHGSDDITAIDAASGKVAGTVQVKGAGEQMVTGKNGLIYVNMEDTNDVVAFDPKTLEVKHRFPIGVGKTPTGLAYDAKYNRLFIGCRGKSMVVMDAANGKVIASMPIGTGVDWAEFDPDSRLAFLSTGDGVLSVFRQVSADVYEDAGAVTTQASAKTFAFDTKTKRLLLPAAEVETIPATGEGKRPQRRTKPGSFVVLVVSK
jgi:YVTN family beta-propeller protein